MLSFSSGNPARTDRRNTHLPSETTGGTVFRRHNISSTLVDYVLRVVNSNPDKYARRTLRLWYGDGRIEDTTFYHLGGYWYKESECAIMVHVGAEDHCGPIYPDAAEPVLDLDGCTWAQVTETVEWSEDEL